MKTAEGQLPQREIDAPVQHLIMEGFRIMDDAAAGKNPFANKN